MYMASNNGAVNYAVHVEYVLLEFSLLLYTPACELHVFRLILSHVHVRYEMRSLFRIDNCDRTNVIPYSSKFSWHNIFMNFII